jgi:hypothetical protein
MRGYFGDIPGMIMPHRLQTVEGANKLTTPWATGWARAVGGKGRLIFLYS